VGAAVSSEWYSANLDDPATLAVNPLPTFRAELIRAR
jgi:hypothetical protein